MSTFRKKHPKPCLTKTMQQPDDLSRIFEGAVLAIALEVEEDYTEVRQRISDGMERMGFDSPTYAAELHRLVLACRNRYRHMKKEGFRFFGDDPEDYEPPKEITGGTNIPLNQTEIPQFTEDPNVTDDVSALTKLGSNTTEYHYEGPESKVLETFPNQFVENSYKVNLVFPEFTSLCPKTGQPDFGLIRVEYIPDKKCIESKSFKMYMFSWRTEGCFMETITNRILNDLVEACEPIYCRVEGEFNARGGVTIVVDAQYSMEGIPTEV